MTSGSIDKLRDIQAEKTTLELRSSMAMTGIVSARYINHIYVFLNSLDMTNNKGNITTTVQID